ncbi:NYN domain-containing protein [Desulfonatronum thiodismutans]|uniref:NYN domain-containing protein n=1 Tax=Desulfonatronum thiodismutans TaxID=159290 RepID=UPI0004ABDFB0|nr:NYN domain-containing protein [Desulfonatronum thiodismutans]
MITNTNLTKIGIFYDGNFFFHVSNYYLYDHSRQSRISINGIHQFIIHEVAAREERPVKNCKIVDMHYFRGRLTAYDAQARDLLLKERIFDDILMKEGVITHYLPMSPEGEKGIDVWLALEAFELAIFKKYDVIVLIASDGDYLPLTRKLNTIGARVMVLGCDFEYVDQYGNHRATKTSMALLDNATYPILINDVIDDPERHDDQIVRDLFVKEKYRPVDAAKAKSGEDQSGTVVSIQGGYGFIRPDMSEEDLFFHYGDLVDMDINRLTVGDRVSFQESVNKKGPCAVRIVVRSGA